MATLFPFNLISKAPTKILDQFLKIVNKQTDQINSLITDLNNSLLSLSKNASCDDAEITALKNKLKVLLDGIKNIQQITNLSPQIAVALRTLNTTATIVGAAQLAVPSAVGVLQGPIGQTIAASADTIASIQACVTILQNVINSINNLMQQVADTVSNVSDTISGICNTPSADGNVNNNIQPTTLDALEQQYFSEFYRSINVSDEDLQKRLNTIQDLINEQLDVTININEAPSKVLSNIGAPADNIGQPGDYYIDRQTQKIYGPKVNLDNWN